MNNLTMGECNVFTKINGKSYEELTHEEIVKSMTQHAFFLFMDRGRGGIEQAALARRVKASTTFTVRAKRYVR